MKLNPDFKAKWVAALRSGKYEQDSGALFSPSSGGYCCLGVACHISGQRPSRLKNKKMPSRIMAAKWFDVKSKDLPPHSTVSSQTYYDAFLIIYRDTKTDLAHLNDTRVPFSTIADLIEEQM